MKLPEYVGIGGDDDDDVVVAAASTLLSRSAVFWNELMVEGIKSRGGPKIRIVVGPSNQCYSIYCIYIYCIVD